MSIENTESVIPEPSEVDEVEDYGDDEPTEYNTEHPESSTGLQDEEV